MVTAISIRYLATNPIERTRAQERNLNGVEWFCDRCGIDIEIGQSFTTDKGRRKHVICHRRRR